MKKRSLASSVALRASLLALLALAFVCAAPAFFFAADGYQCPTVRVTCPERKREGDEVEFTAHVNDMPSGRQPTYSWRVSAGEITDGQNTRQITVDSAGLGGRSLTATVRVGNIDAPCRNTGRCRTRIRERAGLPNSPPTVTLSASSSRVVLAAECAGNEQPDPDCAPTSAPTVQLLAAATDPDGDTLLYTYTTTGGRITGDGPNATLDLTGVAPGTYTVTVEVDDGCRCPTARSTSTVTITVEHCACVPRPAPPRKPDSGPPAKPVSRTLKGFASPFDNGLPFE